MDVYSGLERAKIIRTPIVRGKLSPPPWGHRGGTTVICILGYIPVATRGLYAMLSVASPDSPEDSP